MLAKFAFANLAVKFSALSLLNFSVVIHLSWSWSVAILFSISLFFVLQSVFFNKLLTLGISFSTAVKALVVAKLAILGILFKTSFNLALRAVVVAKLVILGISFLTSFILKLRVVLVAMLIMSGILSSIFLILALYTSFLMTSFFTTSLSLFQSTETGPTTG